ncbi:hypothetical protein NUACC21_49090 [Scytonema sp. NUACC21]
MLEEIFDPRTISKSVYRALHNLRQSHTNNRNRLKEQYNQSVELYTYLATWGMLRLKAEEQALNQDGKKDVVIKYFETLQDLSGVNNLVGERGLNTLSSDDMKPEDYLGLTGLGLQVAREFAFWAGAVYADVKAEAENA